MFRVSILSLARGVNQYPVYKKLMSKQYELTAKQIDDYWASKPMELAQYHFKNNPVYRNFIKQSGLQDLNKVDFSEIPIINKNPLRTSEAINKKQAKAMYSSGGSTGNPFSYSLSAQALAHFWPNLWRAFAVAGYEPGQKMAMIAAPSLFDNRSIKRRIYDLISNFEVLSAFDLNESKLHSLYKLIKRKDIKFIYGYTSAILIFLNYLRSKNLHLDLKGIFTTSETIIPAVYAMAQEHCNCDVFDIYGANDGGILAFECEEHNGYHISSERTFLEIIDKKIILTDLLNTSFPFVRYEVGDISSSNSIIKEKCDCGRSLFRLKSISGRINYFIKDLDGQKIHTEFFSHVLHAEKNIRQFQITNEDDQIIVNIIPMEKHLDIAFFEDKYLKLMRKRFKKELVIKINMPIEKLENQKTPILVERLSE